MKNFSAASPRFSSARCAPRYISLVTAATALISCALLAGCGGGGTSNALIISVIPYTAAVTEGGTINFTASVSGASQTGVTWSVEEGAAGGAITTDGVYTAPSTTGTFHVIATSVANTSKSATATVTVNAVSP